MDPEMSPQAKDILARYRAGQSLDGAARARMLSGLRAKIAVGAPALGASKSALSKILAAGKTKIALGVLAVAVPAAWTIHHSHRSVDYTLRTATPSVPAAPQVLPQPEIAPAPSALDGEPYARAPREAAATPAPVPFESLVPGDVVAPAKRATPSQQRSSTSDRGAAEALKPSANGKAAGPLKLSENGEPAGTSTPEAAPAPESTLDQEIQLLKRANIAEKAGRPSEALAILAEHAKQFPNGKLAESRDVARIIALCEAGQAQAARSAADRFLAARPNSPFKSRVQAACAER